MKQLMLITVCILMLSITSEAQTPIMKFKNSMPYTVYVGGQWGANGSCTSTGGFMFAVPPGGSSIDVSMYGGNLASDELYHIRVYSYDPTVGCVVSSANVSPCLLGNYNDVLQTYDVCGGGTLTTTYVDWTTVSNVALIELHP